MIKRISAVIKDSVLYRVLNKMGAKVGAFCASGAIWQTFTHASEPDGKSKTDRLAAWILQSKLCDFLRSSLILKWVAGIPELPWIFLMVTLIGAMVLPTLAVMLLSLMTLALTLLGLIFGKEKLPPVSGGIRLWLLWALVTLIYTFVNYGGLKGILAGGIRFCMLPLLPVAWVLGSKAKRVWKTVYVFAGASLAVALYGMYQYFTGALSAKWTDVALFSEEMGRLVATFENPNVYGTFLLVAIPVILVAAFFAKGWRGKTFLWVTTALLVLNMVLTYSRGCYVSLVLGLFVLLLCKGRNFLWLGLGALGISIPMLPESVLSRVTSIGNLADSSVSYRLNIWRGSLAMLGKYWWLGVGIGDTAFVSLYVPHALPTVEDAPHAHNLLLQTVAESGVLGLLVLVLFFWFILRDAASGVRREQGEAKWLRLSLIAAWVGLLVQGVTDYIFYNNNLFAIMMISLGFMLAGIGRKDVQNETL